MCIDCIHTVHCAELNSRVHVDFMWPHSYHSALVRSLLTVCAHCRYERAYHALFGPHTQCTIAWSSSIRIETTSGSGLGLRIRIGQMRIQCGRALTGFDPVQCALGVKCGLPFWPKKRHLSMRRMCSVHCSIEEDHNKVNSLTLSSMMQDCCCYCTARTWRAKSPFDDLCKGLIAECSECYVKVPEETTA